MTKVFHLEIPNFQSTKNARGVKQDTMLPAVPSWNDVMQLETWGRAKRKEEIQNAFLSALRASAADSSTKTTCARSTLLIAADTLERSLTIRQQERASRRRNLRLKAKSLKGQS